MGRSFCAGRRLDHFRSDPSQRRRLQSNTRRRRARHPTGRTSVRKFRRNDRRLRRHVSGGCRLVISLQLASRRRLLWVTRDAFAMSFDQLESTEPASQQAPRLSPFRMLPRFGVRYDPNNGQGLSAGPTPLRAINVRFASRRTAAKFASLFDEAGGVVRDMTEIDRTGEHA